MKESRRAAEVLWQGKVETERERESGGAISADAVCDEV